VSVARELEQTIASLASERKQMRSATERTERALQALRKRVELAEARMTPNTMRGVIRNYRYGMNGDQLRAPGVGVKKNTPTHTFDLECGQQVWLHIVLGSREWETFMADAPPELMEDMDEAESLPSFWNGRRVEVRRVEILDRFVPVRLLPVKPLAQDRAGQDVFKGDRVKLFDGTNQDAEVVSYDKGNNRFSVRRDDGGVGGGPYDEEYGEYGGNLWLIGADMTELA